MSFILKLVAVLIIMAIGGYAAIMWEAHQSLVSTSEKLARQIGSEVVEGLREASRSCRDTADLDSVVVKTDSPFSDTGAASVYISGANGRALALDYKIAVAGSKVYLKPKNHASNQGQIMQFALGGCR